MHTLFLLLLSMSLNFSLTFSINLFHYILSDSHLSINLLIFKVCLVKAMVFPVVMDGLRVGMKKASNHILRVINNTSFIG